ncbi:MAG TPA: hypothetical protein VFH27_09385 [Longimicrobiaceae bacterium]|nr:hypothetical protein [Longimicrobiaceae bacterium]
MKKLDLNLENLEVTSFAMDDCDREMPMGYGIGWVETLRDYALSWLIACNA